MNQPKINFGVVKHQRIRPAKNAFGYGVFTISIPMRTRKANPDLLKSKGLSDNRLGLCAFFDKDHGLGESNSLAWIESILQEYGVSQIDVGRIHQSHRRTRGQRCRACRHRLVAHGAQLQRGFAGVVPFHHIGGRLP